MELQVKINLSKLIHLNFLLLNLLAWLLAPISNMLKKAKEYFDLFGIPLRYEINKDILKQKYYSLVKNTHPDLNLEQNESSASYINRAYQIMNDDYMRAKLFTVPSQELSPGFLSKCLLIEEKLNEGTDMTSKIDNQIEKCKKRYDKPKWITKWAYFKRLRDISESLKPRNNL